jgi:hypothetical protein
MAYANGLLSEETFARRLDEALSARLIDSRRLIGDLQLRAPVQGLRARLSAKVTAVAGRLDDLLNGMPDIPHFALALDWSGSQPELLLGREDHCDVRLDNATVSRRHARLLYRDGHWVVQDLDSTNGTFVNGARVHRSELRPGDRLHLGDQPLLID